MQALQERGPVPDENLVRPLDERGLGPRLFEDLDEAIPELRDGHAQRNPLQHPRCVQLGRAQILQQRAYEPGRGQGHLYQLLPELVVPLALNELDGALDVSQLLDEDGHALARVPHPPQHEHELLVQGLLSAHGVRHLQRVRARGCQEVHQKLGVILGVELNLHPVQVTLRAQVRVPLEELVQVLVEEHPEFIPRLAPRPLGLLELGNHHGRGDEVPPLHEEIYALPRVKLHHQHDLIPHGRQEAVPGDEIKDFRPLQLQEDPERHVLSVLQDVQLCEGLPQRPACRTSSLVGEERVRDLSHAVDLRGPPPDEVQKVLVVALQEDLEHHVVHSLPQPRGSRGDVPAEECELLHLGKFQDPPLPERCLLEEELWAERRGLGKVLHLEEVGQVVEPDLLHRGVLQVLALARL